VVETGAPGRTLNAISTEKTQETAKWVVAALAATAGVVFGVGPLVSRPDVDWGEDTGQLATALIAGAAGLGGMVWLIMLIARVLAPPRVTLAKLPGALEDEINQNGSWLLPSDATDFAEFRTKFDEWKDFTSATRTSAALHRREAGDLEAAGDTTGARAARDLASRAAADHRVGAANVALYQRRADRILDEARFESVRAQLDFTKITVAAVVAALGALAFTLALAEEPDEEEPAAEAVPSTATIGYIPPASGDVQETLWSNLDLQACALEGLGTVPVLVQGGTGAADDPWIVTTFSPSSNDSCVSQTFDLHQAVVSLRIPDPQDVVIVYDSGLDEAGEPVAEDTAADPAPTTDDASPSATDPSSTPGGGAAGTP